MPLQGCQAGVIRSCLLTLLMAFSGARLLHSNGMQESPGNPKNGRDLFVGKGCIRCHSVWKVNGKRGPSLASIGMGRNLYELCASIWSHWSRMNAVIEQDNELRVSLTATEFKDIIAYLYYLNYSAEPGQADLGEEVFNRKGCVQCHATEPLQSSSRPGRPVYEMRQFQNAVNMAVAVWNHGTDMYQRMSGRKMAWPQFEPKEVAHLVEFIRSRTGASVQSTMAIPGDPLRGRSLFVSRTCASCHVSGTKASAKAPNLASSGTATSLSSLIAGLWNHYPRMSQTITTSGVTYPKIAKEEMEDILAYVYWLKAYGLAGNPVTGRNLYQAKQCASCHSPSPEKPAAAPTLVRSETTGSTYGLLAAIWNHGPRMESLLRERHISWPTLTGEEMRDLVAFFQKAKADGSGRLGRLGPDLAK